MNNIDKKDIENIEKLEKILKSKDLTSISIKKDKYEIKVSKNSNLDFSESKANKMKINKELSNTVKDDLHEVNKDNIVTSPMVGIVFLSPEPSKPAYIKEGQHVKQGETIMLIEAMKTFNEIKAPKTGVIKKIIALNSKPVEFGETLVILE